VRAGSIHHSARPFRCYDASEAWALADATLLYDPQRHEILSEIPWDEISARETIAEIVGDTVDHFDPGQFWPVHPREDTRGVLKGLWFGAAGVVWALHYLAECGATHPRLDCADAVGRVHAKFVTDEDPRVYSGSFLMGEIGNLLVQWRITRGASIADRLFKLIEEAAEQATEN
jgi:hypothetical protein